MADTIHIPKLLNDDQPGPAWVEIHRNGKPCKPLIKCKCGKVCGIGLHHVHADGRVTASFYHANVDKFEHNGKTYRCQPGCGFHVHLILKDYNLGEFPPVP